MGKLARKFDQVAKEYAKSTKTYLVRLSGSSALFVSLVGAHTLALYVFLLSAEAAGQVPSHKYVGLMLYCEKPGHKIGAAA